ncbi:MAG: FISUMP domain-containing protein, partial [Methanococcaceae archaeon]
MKKYLLIAFIFISLDTNAQNYLINFAGTGASSTVTSVKVENLTSGVNCVINGNDILSISNVLTSINGIEKDPSIETKIYPNPMIDYSTFVVFPRVSGTAFLSVFDMTGKLVSKVKYFFNDSPQQFRLSGFRSGVYLITVDGSNYRYSTKLISYGNANGVIRIEQLFSKQELEFEKVKKSSKGAMDAVRFEYNPGDMLKFTGTSGIYSTVKTLVPTKDETITFNFIPCTDANSNNYPIVEIGDQIWMGTDLRATKFNDGTIITNITDEAEWQGLITPAYCWLHNYINSTVGGGALYTFYVVAYQDKDICPVGWHVPTNDEWNILANYLGSDIAGGKLKERGTDLWLSPNTGADNSTGFTAYPDGSRYNNGLFYDSGWRNSYWTSTSSSGSGIGRRLVAYSSNIETFYSPKNFGSHIRCVNGVISIPKLTTSLITDIFYTSATAGGNVTSDGGSFISEEGICISTSSNPTTSDSKIILNYHTIGVFTIPITNLVQNTTYYVRAYATNKVGTAYGEQISFKTLPSYGLDVTTAPISFSSQIGATGGGSVASDGAAVITERGICISVNPNPVISDRKIVTSGSIGSFDSDITGLTANTTYYVRAFATNTLGTTYGREVFFSTKGESGTITDIEGNIYSTIEIGAQIWMTENLRTTKYSDGSSIPNVTDDDTWGAQTSGSFCWYNNDISNKNVYGGLYNHFAVTDLRHLCPTGWHIPSSEEWKNMSSYIEGSNWWSIIPPVTNGEKLRETGTVHWDAPNSGASNTSGFTAVPGGFRTSDGYFVGKGMVGEYWFDFSYSDDPYDLSQIFSVSQGLLQMPYAYNIDGHSVRCISDNIPLPISITTSASSITSFGATLNGQINPENQTVNAIFEYGLTNTYGNSIMANPNSLAGNTISYVNANISGLTSGSTYHYRLKLVYSGGTIFGNDMTFTLPIKVTDIDNNSYNVAIVGKRVWMVEDLRTFKYSDGSPISGVYQYNDFFNQGVPSNNWLYTWSAAMKGAS